MASLRNGWQSSARRGEAGDEAPLAQWIPPPAVACRAGLLGENQSECAIARQRGLYAYSPKDLLPFQPRRCMTAAASPAHLPAHSPSPAYVSMQGLDEPYIAGLREIFEERIVFNQLLGLKLVGVKDDALLASLEMRHELIGHFGLKRIHGGVISASLDALGGIAVMAASGAKHVGEPVMQRLMRFGKLGTIDLRVDYLRPGTHGPFAMQARVLRLGSRVATTRSDFCDSTGQILATATAAYIVS